MKLIPYFISGVLCCSASMIGNAANSDIKKDLDIRRSELVKPQVLDSIQHADLSAEQREALNFLYAYMPLVDISSHPLDFFVKNVNASLKARAEMPWGKTVPQREFLHFVLPPRVNNENLDMARPVFYEELKNRVKGLSMEEAILEVNHWCHEKATYRPSDARTSTPLSTVSQAIGRCGEESTFTVAALRSVGIPARQVYTPRWAHTDDNHAWVEAWANGKWYFLGACEPEPILNVAWFNAPAARGMLMATNVIGRYDGPEEKIYTSPRLTRINVTENYAPIDTMRVRVVNADGTPAQNAQIRFGIYNYAEFYPVATKPADADGKASLTTGLGDMVIWATNGKEFGFVKMNPNSKDATVVLQKPETFDGKAMEFDIIPPKPSGNLPKVTDEQRQANNIRFQYEDSVRAAYEATFFKETNALPESLTSRISVERQKQVKTVLVLSRGNHKMLVDFLNSQSNETLPFAIDILASLVEKDLRDIPENVLRDCIENAPKVENISNELYLNYVVQPRVLWEPLSPTKAFFGKILTDDQKKQFAKDPLKLVKFVSENISIDRSSDPTRLQSMPLGVWEQRVADPVSRSIFFVQAARACGIPARIESVTGKTQFAKFDGKVATWYDVFTNETSNEAVTSPQGLLKLNFEPTKFIVEPKYYYQFAIAKITDGVANTLELGENVPFSEQFGKPVSLDTGRYMLTTGQRMANGTVLARVSFFEIKQGETTNVELVFRQDNSQPAVIGNLNAEDLYFDLQTKSEKSILSTTGRGYYVLGIIHPNQEPTAHAINEISALRKELEETGNAMVLLFTDKEAASRFQPEKYGQLPSSLHFGIDSNSIIKNEIAASLHLDNTITLPLFVVADSFNRIVYVSQGYSIGTAERILQTLRKVNDPK